MWSRGWPLRHVPASSSAGAIARTRRSATPRAPSRAMVARHDRAQHDPDVDASGGDRREPDVAIADQHHPGVADREAIRVDHVVREPDPPPEIGRPLDTRSPPDDRSRAVGPDDDIGIDGDRHAIEDPVDPALREVHGGGRPTGSNVGPRGARCRQHGWVERGPIEPHGRLAAGIGAIGKAERGPATRLDAHRRDRSGHPVQDLARKTEPPQRRDRRRGAEHPAGPPPPPGRTLQDHDLASGPGQQDRERGAGRPATDDRDLGPLRHGPVLPHPGGQARSGGQRRSHTGARTGHGPCGPGRDRTSAAARAPRRVDTPVAPRGGRHGVCTGSASAGDRSATPPSSRDGCDAGR